MYAPREELLADLFPIQEGDLQSNVREQIRLHMPTAISCSMHRRELLSWRNMVYSVFRHVLSESLITCG